MIRIILIRHGHTEWNSEGEGERFRGTVDLPLADQGVIQAQITAQCLAALPLTAVYASPLQRAARTAQIIAAPHGLTPRTLPGLGSMNYGEWTGKLHADVALGWPDLYRQWRHNPFSIKVPGGESAADLRDRAFAALRTALAQHKDGDTIAVISHQVVTKTLTCVLAGLSDTAYWQIRQDLCNLSRFDYDLVTDRFTVVGLNDTCHLAPQLAVVATGETGIILIRHGQTAWNEGASGSIRGGEERFRGRADLPLDDTGQAQARAVASRLQREPITALYASPLLRAQQTLAPLAGILGLPVAPHEGLLDIHYGCFQGLTHADAAKAYPELYGLWRIRPSQVRFPGGENLADIQARLLHLLQEMATRHAGQTIALVGHQMVNKVLSCTLLGLDLDQIWRVQQDTCALDVFQQANGMWTTLCLNDTCHLIG